MGMRRWAVVTCALLALGVSGTAQAQGFDPSDDGQVAYVDGNLLFLTYHEVGHMLLDQLLEVDQQSQRLASEEAADDIATWLLAPDPDEPEQDEEIWAAVEGWSRSAETSQGVAKSPHYPDDAVRAARIACYLYGSNPELYPELAEDFENSLSSVNCAEEVDVLNADIEAWFGDHVIEEDAPGGAAIRVTYEGAPASLRVAQSYLRASGILEAAAEDISQFVSLPRDVVLVARSCGPGAAEFRYSPSARRITACYEAVDWLMRDAADEQQDIAEARAETDDEMGSGGARVPRRPRPRVR